MTVGTMKIMPESFDFSCKLSDKNKKARKTKKTEKTQKREK